MSNVGTIRFLASLELKKCLKKDRDEGDLDAEHREQAQMVSIEETRQKNAKCLSHRHYDGEDYWTEFFNGGKDE